MRRIWNILLCHKAMKCLETDGDMSKRQMSWPKLASTYQIWDNLSISIMTVMLTTNQVKKKKKNQNYEVTIAIER